MKLSRETSSVETGIAEAKPRDFKIAANKEAFAILSSGLYNNQIGAVIRELSCNAYDAHVAANKGHIPFDIHLPNRFEPYFAVTDYGIGMSEEQVYKLYTTYFGTDKSESNDFVGALGLGSKSPFSYTEGFTIVSKYNGKKSTYTCYISETGTPTVQKQITVDDFDEEEPFFAQSMNNGVQIQFPVKVQDIQEFYNNASKMLEFFDPMPNLNEDIKIIKHDYAMRTENWAIRKSDYYSTARGVRAVQGMVVYSVGTIDQSKLSYEEGQLLRQPLDLFFPIGELSVAASRETLKNDERTVENIIKAIKNISHTYAEEMKKQLAECETRWEAELFIDNMLHHDNPLKDLLDNQYRRGFFDGDYKKFKIDHNKGYVTVNQYDHIDVTIYSFDAGYASADLAAKSRMFTEEEPRRKHFNEIKAGTRKREEFSDFRIEPNKSTKFIIGDIPFGAEKFVHHYLQKSYDNRNRGNDRITRVYLIARANKDVSVDRVKFEAISIINKLGSPPYDYLTNLKARYWDGMKGEKAETVDRGVTAFNTGQYIQKYGDSGYERKGWREGWSRTFQVDQTTGKYMIPKGKTKYYLKLNKGQPIAYKFQNAEDFRVFLINISQSGEFNYNHEKDFIYGMPENSIQAKEAEKERYTDSDGFEHPEWVEFSKMVWDKLLKIITPELEMKLSLQVKAFNAGDLEEMFPRFITDLPSTSAIRQFAESVAKARKINVTKAEALAKVIAAASENGITQIKNVKDFTTEWSKLLESYPLLPLLTYRKYFHNHEEIKKAVIEYIELIDEKRRFEDLLKEGDQHTQLYLEAQELDVQTEQQKESINVTCQEVEEETNQEITAEYTPSICPEEGVCSSNTQ